jgi:hypothetical protein
MTGAGFLSAGENEVLLDDLQRSIRFENARNFFQNERPFVLRHATGDASDVNEIKVVVSEREGVETRFVCASVSIETGRGAEGISGTTHKFAICH